MDTIRCTIAWLAGCAAGLFLIDRHPGGLEPVYGWLMLLLALLALVPLILAHSNRHFSMAAWILIALLAALGRTLLIHPPVTPRDLAYYNSNLSATQVVGIVSAEPAFSDRSQRLRISAQTVRLSGDTAPRQVAGDMYVVVARYPEFGVGERLSLSGTLTVPLNSGGFDYRGYLARQGVFSYMAFPRVLSLGHADLGWLSEPLASTRAAVKAALQRAIAEPEASLTVGVVTGDRSSMTQQAQQAFQRSGTTHILAISGENISLLVGTVWLFAGGRKGRRRMAPWPVGVMLGLLVFYTAFTGSTPSVVRAAIMGAILLCAPLVGRRYDPIAALAIPAFAMTLFDPSLLADAGFELTFAAMLGIALVSPHLQSLFSKARIPAIVAVPIAASLGAQAASLPISMLLFGQISPASPFATLTADIALLPLMVAGIATGIVGIIIPQLGYLIGLAAWLCAHWMLFWVQLWAALPGASLDVEPIKPGWALVYYIALGVGLWLGNNYRSGKLMLNKRATALAGATACVWALLLVLFLGG